MAIIGNLDNLPTGATVFVDTMIFDLHYRGKSQACEMFLQRVVDGEITAYVNIEVLSDLLHKLMLAEAFAKDLIPRRSARLLRQVLAADRSLATSLTDYQRHFEDTLSIGLEVLRVTKRLLVDSKSVRIKYGLLTGDSIHLTSLWRKGIRDLVTNDCDFDLVPDLRVWKPLDVLD